MTMFKNFLTDESGASAAEYAIILAIIGTVLVTAMTDLRDAIKDAIDGATDVIAPPAP